MFPSCSSWETSSTQICGKIAPPAPAPASSCSAPLLAKFDYFSYKSKWHSLSAGDISFAPKLWDIFGFARLHLCYHDDFRYILQMILAFSWYKRSYWFYIFSEGLLEPSLSLKQNSLHFEIFINLYFIL